MSNLSLWAKKTFEQISDFIFRTWLTFFNFKVFSPTSYCIFRQCFSTSSYVNTVDSARSGQCFSITGREQLVINLSLDLPQRPDTSFEQEINWTNEMVSKATMSTFGTLLCFVLEKDMNWSDEMASKATTSVLRILLFFLLSHQNSWAAHRLVSDSSWWEDKPLWLSLSSKGKYTQVRKCCRPGERLRETFIERLDSFDNFPTKLECLPTSKKCTIYFPISSTGCCQASRWGCLYLNRMESLRKREVITWGWSVTPVSVRDKRWAFDIWDII